MTRAVLCICGSCKEPLPSKQFAKKANGERKDNCKDCEAVAKAKKTQAVLGVCTVWQGGGYPPDRQEPPKLAKNGRKIGQRGLNRPPSAPPSLAPEAIAAADSMHKLGVPATRIAKELNCSARTALSAVRREGAYSHFPVKGTAEYRKILQSDAKKG